MAVRGMTLVSWKLFAMCGEISRVAPLLIRAGQLWSPGDAGRTRTIEIAKKAIDPVIAVQPAALIADVYALGQMSSGAASTIRSARPKACLRGLSDEPVAEIVPNTQPRDFACVFNNLQHRVISLSNSPS